MLRRWRGVGLGMMPWRRIGVCCVAIAGCMLWTNALVSQTSGADTFSHSGWTLMGTPFAYDQPQGAPAISCVSSTFCMSVGAVGDKNQPSGTAPADEWNGSTWAPTSLPVPTNEKPATSGQPVSVSCSSNTFCLAIGFLPPKNAIFVDRWDGSTWSSLPGPPSMVPYDVDCLSTEACIVVGANDGTPQTIEWNGATWTTMPNTAVGVGTLASVSCADISACMAVGSNDDGTLASERWDGSNWSDVSIPNEVTGSLAEFLTSVSCPTPSSCVAVGWHSFAVTPTSGGEAPIVDTWDGTAWSREPLPITLVAGLNDTLNSVGCYGSGQCIAVGGANPVTPGIPPLVLSSDNGRWSVVGDPPVDPNQPSDSGYGPQPVGPDQRPARDPNDYAINVLDSISCVTGWSCVVGGINDNARVGQGIYFADAQDTAPSAPIADITSPIDGQVFATGWAATAAFSCSPGLDDPGLSSCIDSSGSTGPHALDTSTPGAYSYTVTATSQDGLSATATVHYTVAGAPSVAISNLDSGQTYGLDQLVPTDFACADGAEGPGIFLCMDSNSSPSPGALDTSSAGPHSYGVVALSQDGLYSITTIDYTVVTAAAPTSVITAPAPASAPGSRTLYQLNQVVPTAFACTEGVGGPGIASCADSSGSASPGRLDTSQPGPHTYTVTATSQDGVKTTSSIMYIVVGPPTVQIALPTEGQTFQIDQSVTTHFGCTDDVAGPGIASCVDVKGSTSPGSLDTSTLGSHTYSVTATSKDGQSGTVSVDYTVVPADSSSTTTTSASTTTTTTATATTTTTTTTAHN